MAVRVNPSGNVEFREEPVLRRLELTQNCLRLGRPPRPGIRIAKMRQNVQSGIAARFRCLFHLGDRVPVHRLAQVHRTEKKVCKTELGVQFDDHLQLRHSLIQPAGA